MGSDRDPLYHHIYFWAVALTTTVAAWIGQQEAKTWWSSAGCIAMTGMTIANAPNQVMLLQAAFLGLAAAQTVESDDARLRTLGWMWTVQAGLFAFYAMAEPINPALWHWLGDWLPAAVMIVAFLALIRQGSNSLRDLVD